MDKKKKRKKKFVKTSKPNLNPKERSTELRKKMETRLNGAKFRMINEEISLAPINKLDTYFEHITKYKDYHKTFNALQDLWPEKPFDKIFANLSQRSKHKVIADMGCGDAKLAHSLPNLVYSFDLISTNEKLLPVPLDKESVDIVVFCLSLMGTKVTPFIKEANRILKLKGTLIIAELANRFYDLGRFISALHQMGFVIKEKDQTNTCFWILYFQKSKCFTRPIEIKLKPFLYKKR